MQLQRWTAKTALTAVKHNSTFTVSSWSCKMISPNTHPADLPVCIVSFMRGETKSTHVTTQVNKKLVTFSLYSQCLSAAATAPLCCPVWRRESGDDPSNTVSPPLWAWKADVGQPHPPWVSLSTLQTPCSDLKEDSRQPRYSRTKWWGCGVFKAYGYRLANVTTAKTDLHKACCAAVKVRYHKSRCQ